MNILLAEYTVHHDRALAPEGAAMFNTLKKSFEKIGYTVLSPEQNKDFGEEIKRLGPLCQDGLVIAPDSILPRYTKILEDHTRNCGCNSFSIAVCANKKRTAEVLEKHGIDVPAEITKGKRIIKPIKGCGSVGMRYLDEEPEEGEIGQEYIEGEHLSVSLVGSRVVGETCLYYTGEGPLILAVNRQLIHFDDDGTVIYNGGETPYFHQRHDEIIEIAKKTNNILGCQGYIGIDMIVSDDRIVVVDVNPRPTTSLIGISACMEEEIAQIILDASYGKAPSVVHLKGHAQYDTHGQVSYDRN